MERTSPIPPWSRQRWMRGTAATGAASRVAQALPEGVPQFNWAAFFFPLVWPAVYGVTSLACVAAGATLAAAVFTLIAPQGAVVYAMLPLASAFWVGAAANEYYWRDNPLNLTVDEFCSRQTPWIMVGAALAVITVGVGVIAWTGALQA